MRTQYRTPLIVIGIISTMASLSRSPDSGVPALTSTMPSQPGKSATLPVMVSAACRASISKLLGNVNTVVSNAVVYGQMPPVPFEVGGSKADRLGFGNVEIELAAEPMLLIVPYLRFPALGRAAA